MSFLHLLTDLVHQVNDAQNPLAVDLAACGRLRDFQAAAQNSLDPDSPSREALDALIDDAYIQMSASRTEDPYPWRRLYTDACLVRALIDVAHTDRPNENAVMATIARLDRALVVAGAPGQKRHDLILTVIAAIQKAFLPSTLFNPENTPSSPSLPPVAPLASSFHSIPRFNTPPSLGIFLRDLRHRPFIMSGYAKEWPAMNEHPWRCMAYMRSVAGLGRVVPVEVGGDYRKDDWSQQIIPWDAFLDSLEATQEDTLLYLAQHNLFYQFPDLRNDIIVPDYVYSAPDAPVDYPAYKPPSNEDALVTNVWLGPKGTVSPAHTDPFFNLYAQVVGRKTVWVAPPSATPSLYPYSPPSDASEGKNNTNANATEPSMSNTSRVDVFAVPDDTFPDFWESVVPNAMSTTLEPGDVLFFPPGWWHAMRSEDLSFSVSMWF
ncbi:Clavaminate synthase-like protein [Amylostereum chailletii]|nr:Clavaminate synthase-like protein [Amylostereum chailletii]